MRRLFALIATAGTAATAGYALHQALGLKQDENLQEKLVVGPPVTAVAIGALAGLLFGGRRLPAFVAALLAATFLGKRLDGMIPGLPETPGVPASSVISQSP